jgi:putative aminopeptidase FrvX
MNENKLIEILAIQSESYNQTAMFQYIVSELTEMGCELYEYNGCIYATKGNADLYTCVVSHMDTVHTICEDLTPIGINGNITGFNAVTMEQTGIGGDDKVGIFIAIQCLESFDNIKAVFFRDEEVGCEGSYDPDHDFFNDCSFVLQCDRKGNSGFVTNAGGTELSSKQFQNDLKPILKQYGYKTVNGMMTDVMALKESDILCSMANIECGYYNPHTAQEYVNINDVQNCLNMVKKIITDMSGKDYPCKYQAPKHKGYKSAKYDYFNRWDKIDSIEGNDDFCTCDCCNEESKLEYISDFNMMLCSKCVSNYLPERVNKWDWLNDDETKF